MINVNARKLRNDIALIEYVLYVYDSSDIITWGANDCTTGLYDQLDLVRIANFSKFRFDSEYVFFISANVERTATEKTTANIDVIQAKFAFLHYACSITREHPVDVV